MRFAFIPLLVLLLVFDLACIFNVFGHSHPQLGSPSLFIKTLTKVLAFSSLLASVTLAITFELLLHKIETDTSSNATSKPFRPAVTDTLNLTCSFEMEKSYIYGIGNQGVLYLSLHCT